MPDAPIPNKPATNTITGRDAFLRVLSDEGVVKMFGNPGTTELPRRPARYSSRCPATS